MELLRNWVISFPSSKIFRENLKKSVIKKKKIHKKFYGKKNNDCSLTKN